MASRIGSQAPASKWPATQGERYTIAFAGVFFCTNTSITRGVVHTIRYTFASRLVMAGVDLKTVQELMGHKTIAMTARHAHLAPTHKLRALETLVHPGSVSVQSGYKLATNTKEATRSSKLNSLQLIECK